MCVCVCLCNRQICGRACMQKLLYHVFVLVVCGLGRCVTVFQLRWLFKGFSELGLQLERLREVSGTHTRSHSQRIHTYTHTHIHTYTHTHIHTYTHTHIHTHIHTNPRMHIHTYILHCLLIIQSLWCRYSSGIRTI